MPPVYAGLSSPLEVRERFLDGVPAEEQMDHDVRFYSSLLMVARPDEIRSFFSVTAQLIQSPSGGDGSLSVAGERMRCQMPLFGEATDTWSKPGHSLFL